MGLVVEFVDEVVQDHPRPVDLDDAEGAQDIAVAPILVHGPVIRRQGPRRTTAPPALRARRPPRAVRTRAVQTRAVQPRAARPRMDGHAIGALQRVAFPSISAVSAPGPGTRRRNTAPEHAADNADNDAVLPNDSPLSAAGR